MKVLNTPEEVADFVNSAHTEDVDVSGALRDGESWILVTKRSSKEEFEYKLSTVVEARQMGLIKDMD